MKDILMKLKKGLLITNFVLFVLLNACNFAISFVLMGSYVAHEEGLISYFYLILSLVCFAIPNAIIVIFNIIAGKFVHEGKYVARKSLLIFATVLFALSAGLLVLLIIAVNTDGLFQYIINFLFGIFTYFFTISIIYFISAILPDIWRNKNEEELYKHI